MSNKAKHAFGSEANVDAALASGKIDAYDLLFLDEGKIGWIDRNGNKVIIEDNNQVMTLSGDSLPESGQEGVVYIFEDAGYIWNGERFVPLAKSHDLLELENKIESKVDEQTVDQKIQDALSEFETDSNHTHSNKAALDYVTSEKVSNWDAAAAKVDEFVEITSEEINALFYTGE